LLAATSPSPAQQKTLTLVKRPDFLVLPSASPNITAAEILAISRCEFRPKLKAGMTNQEANDALDAAWAKFLSCWQNLGRRPGDKSKP
jgi:hypothetical protein